MQIAFWSPNHGQTGVTTATMAYASMTALTNNLKVLIGHSQLHDSTMEHCLLKSNPIHEEGLTYFKDHGLSTLRRLMKNGRLSMGMVKDYTTPLLGHMNLDLLEGIKEAIDITEDEAKRIRHIYQIASKEYDLVFLDLHSGTNQALTKGLITDSDIVVVCLNQNIQLIQQFIESYDIQEMLEGKRCFHHIGKYDGQSKYSIKNIEKLFGFKDIMKLPYHTPFLDACNQSQALDYLMRTIDVKKRDKSYGFIKSIQEGTDQLMAETINVEQEVFAKHA